MNAKHVPEKLVAKVIDFDVNGKSAEECADYVIKRIKELSKEVGIPERLEELGVKHIDLDLLSENTMKDIYAPENPVKELSQLLLNIHTWNIL